MFLQTFVYDNDLYYQPSPFTPPRRLTQSGNSTLRNGIADWLYEGAYCLCVWQTHRSGWATVNKWCTSSSLKMLLEFDSAADCWFRVSRAVKRQQSTQRHHSVHTHMYFAFKMYDVCLTTMGYWCVAEEIFRSHVTHWWSTQSNYICYAEIDDTNVPGYQYPSYGLPTNLYGSIETLSYPKVRFEVYGACALLSFTDVRALIGASVHVHVFSNMLTVARQFLARRKRITLFNSVVTGGRYESGYESKHKALRHRYKRFDVTTATVQATCTTR